MEGVTNLLRSSILGKEFIRYKIYTTDYERRRFYKRAMDNKKIPIIVDSLESEYNEIFRKKEYIDGERVVKYGLEIEMDPQKKIKDLIREIKIELLKNEKEYIYMDNNIRIGLEDGVIISNTEEYIVDIYRSKKNEKDNILYILVTHEKTIYSYIMSIIRYILRIKN